MSQWKHLRGLDEAPSNGRSGDRPIGMPQVASTLETDFTTNGQYYYDSTNDRVRMYVNGAWATVSTSAGAGDNTLDEAYDQGGAGAGRTITADSGAVAITVTDTSNNVALTLTQNDTTNNPATLTFANAGTGNDITGSSVWSIGPAGVAVFAGITGTTGTFTGAVVGASFDAQAAGGLTIGGSTATSVTITPNTTVAGTFTSTGAATFSAGMTQSGGNMSFTTSATTGNGFLIDGSTVTSGNVLRVEYDATNAIGGFGAIEVTEDGVAVFTIGEDGNTVIAGTASGTDALTLTAGDITLTSGDVTMTDGNLILSAGGIQVTGDAASDALGLAPAADGAAIDLNLAATSNLAGGYIDVDGSTGSGPILEFAVSGAYTGDFMSLNLTNAVGAKCLDITGAGTRTATLIHITDTPGSAAPTFNLDITPEAAQATAHVFDIDVAGTGTANVIDIDFAAAYTGDALSINMTNAVGASAIDLTGAGTRTTPLIAITDVPTTSAPTIDLNITPGASVQAGIDIDVAGTSGADILSIDFSAAHTGDAINITMDNAGAAAQALVINGGQTAASGNIVDISSSSAFAGGTGHLLALTSSGNLAAATDGAVLDIAETGNAQATSWAVTINSTNNEALHIDSGVMLVDESLSNVGTAMTVGRGPNYIAAGGSNNAITGTLNDVGGTAVPLADGLLVLVDLQALTLQAGANTFDFNSGGALSIVSHNNVASNIGTAYSAQSHVLLCYNAGATAWEDMSQ